MRVRIAPGAGDLRTRSPTARAEHAGAGVTAATNREGSIVPAPAVQPSEAAYPLSMPINGGLFIGLDGTTFIRHVHAAVAG